MSSGLEQPTPRAAIERVVEWADTDASGHYHHSTVLRWVEAAEAALLEGLGLARLFGFIPRVHYEVDFHDRRWFRDSVSVAVKVQRVGSTSVEYAFTVHHRDQLTASGALAAVHIDKASGRPAPWPGEVRALLSGSTAGPTPR